MPHATALILLYGLNIWTCLACAAREPLSVKLFDDAAVGSALLVPAMAEAAWLLGTACVDVSWIPCAAVTVANLTPCPAPGNAVEVHVLASPLTTDASRNAMGLAMPRLGSGGRACVFLSRVRQTLDSEPDIISVSELLGHVMAHEIGHLLLRSSEHSSEGLMRADFRTQDLRKAAQRRLLFTRAQTSAIQKRVLAEARSSAKAGVL